MLKLLLSVAMIFAVGAAALADPPPKKKPTYPPPEESATVGVLGARKPSTDGAGNAKLGGPPPAIAAAPSIEKVEAEPPAPLAAAPREVVRSDDATINGSGAAAYRLPVAKPSGFLPDHPLLSGLVAGLIGSDLGSKLYGGQIVGDSTAATVGYVVRVGVILMISLLLFQLIGRRAIYGDEPTPPKKSAVRREPGFGQSEPVQHGRREPHFGERE